MNNNFVNQGGSSIYTDRHSYNQSSNSGLSEISLEYSYVENILKLNKGKQVEIYTSYPDSVEWRDRKFSGIIEQAGRDHVILSDPKSGDWYLLLLSYIDYVVSNEKIISNQEFYSNN